MILSFRTGRFKQTMQTHIRLLQGLHCLPFCLHLFDAFLSGEAAFFKFQGGYSKFSSVGILKIFM